MLAYFCFVLLSTSSVVLPFEDNSVEPESNHTVLYRPEKPLLGTGAPVGSVENVGAVTAITDGKSKESKESSEESAAGVENGIVVEEGRHSSEKRHQRQSENAISDESSEEGSDENTNMTRTSGHKKSHEREEIGGESSEEKSADVVSYTTTPSSGLPDDVYSGFEGPEADIQPVDGDKHDSSASAVQELQEAPKPAGGFNIPATISNFRRSLFGALGFNSASADAPSPVEERKTPKGKGTGNAFFDRLESDLGTAKPANGKPKTTRKPKVPKTTPQPPSFPNSPVFQQRPQFNSANDKLVHSPKPTSGQGKVPYPQDKNPYQQPISSGDNQPGCNTNQARPYSEGPGPQNNGWQGGVYPHPANNFGMGWGPSGWNRPPYPARPNWNSRPENPNWNEQYPRPDSDYEAGWQTSGQERPRSASSEEHDGGSSTSQEAALGPEKKNLKPF